MYRLNCNITDEAEKILKAHAKRFGTSMGTVVTMFALNAQKETDILGMTKLIDQVMSNGSAPVLPGSSGTESRG